MNSKKEKFTKPVLLVARYLALGIYTKRDNVQGIYRNLYKLKPIYKKKPAYYNRLAKLAYRQKKWKQALDHINIAIHLSNGHTSNEFKLFKAECFIHLGESTNAILCLNEYLSAEPNDTKLWRKLAGEYEKLHQWKEAASSLESFLKVCPEDSKVSFRLAECYRKRNDFQRAEANYRQVTKNLDNKNLGQNLSISYYRIGLMQLKDNNFEQAYKSFNEAIDHDRELNSQRFGIGVFHEHYKQSEYVIEAYKNQLQLDDQDAELHYKLASLLDKLNTPEKAMYYYENALNLDKVRAEWHYSLANCYEKIREYQQAIKWYHSAIARQQKHNPEWYRRLAFVLEKTGQSNKALVAYQEANLFRRPADIDKKFYDKNINNSTTRYAISYEYYQIDDRMIFYESMAGSRLMDNPLALFQMLFNDEEFKNYTHVWSIKNLDDVPDEYRNHTNVLFVKRDTDLYRRYSSSAKFIITNSKLSKHLTRKPEQKLLDTWHGTALKTIGGHDKASPLGFKNANRVFLSTTNILTPNSHMSNIQQNCYQFRHIYSGQMAETGYPRIDSTININSDERHQLAKELGVHLDQPIVLYAPTWRGTYSNNFYDVSKLQDDLAKISEQQDIQLIFRGHHLSEKHIKGKLDNIKIVPPNIDSNKLLGVVDLLITDYSSIFYDYLVTDKPIIHYLYDLEEYTENRGLYFGVDELPGNIAYTIDEVVNFINLDLKTDYKPSKKYSIAKQRFCPHEDGHVSERVIDWFFRGKTEQVKLVDTGNKPTILVYGGDFTPGDKTDVFLENIRKLDLHKYNVDVIIPTNVAGSKEKLQQFSLLPEQSMIIPYTDGMIMTLQERKAIEHHNLYGTFIDNDMKKDYEKAFTREVRRIVGDSQFVSTIDYGEDSTFWKSFLNNVNIVK